MIHWKQAVQLLTQSCMVLFFTFEQHQRVDAVHLSPSVLVQELPKSAERVPSRAIYLYRTDGVSACKQFVLDGCCSAGTYPYMCSVC